MKQFIKKSVLFIGVLIIGIVITSMAFNTYIGNKAYIKLNPNIKSIVFGHSHVECAFNDSLISNFKNLAESGESYFYTYIKAKQVLEQNPNIETVFIEYSNVDVGLIKDSDIWSDKYINWRYPTYSALMDEKERLFLLSKNPKSLLKTLPKTFKRQLNRIEKGNFNYSNSIGGYLQLKKSKIDSLLNSSANLKASNPDYYKASYYNLRYLKKLIALCEIKNLNVFLVRSPLYRDSYYLSNENLLQSIKQKEFTAIKFLDFKDFPLNNDEYRDLNHINYKGAAKFSTWFNTMLIDSIHTNFNTKK